MVGLLQVILLSVIQAFTEWLPVSSSGHLAILENIFSIENPIELGVVLHLASVIALCVFLRKEIKHIVKEIFNKKYKLLLYIIIATIPAGLAGFFLEKYVESVFSNLNIVAFGLTLTALALFSTKFIQREGKVTLTRAITTGLFQAIAIFPGISRSGLTISGALYSGIEKKRAIKFTLLLAIPIIFGAFLYKISGIVSILESNILIGFIITGVLSYLALMLFVKIVEKNKLYYFGFYCLFLAFLLLIQNIAKSIT